MGQKDRFVFEAVVREDTTVRVRVRVRVKVRVSVSFGGLGLDLECAVCKYMTWTICGI